MGWTVRSLCTLVCLVALGSAQNIVFNAGSSACLVNGSPGTCKFVVDCPALLDHVRSSNLVALRAAKSTCGRPPGGAQQLCCANTGLTVAPPPATFRNHRECGLSAFAPGRIVGGEPVRHLRDFPWMTALKWNQSDTVPAYRCGGAVINERWVLTAAHCIVDGGPVAVRIRDLDLATDTDDIFSDPPENVPVESVFRHPDYHRVYRSPNRGLFSDIALLKLNRDIVFSAIAKPLCLPTRQRSTAEYEHLRRAYIAGWGLTEFAGDSSFDAMMWASVNISDHQHCQATYRRSGARVDDAEHLCAAGNDLKQPGCVPGANDTSCEGGVDACEGDSGGPLMERREQSNRQRWYAIGVVSYGTGCGNPSFPGLYARVDHFMDWIAETVAGN